ncbi:hypothetical protein LJC57_04910 [Parabacteroides sp. OttesenSCG-928-G07]|nr:hypothetical protein [Parabacteroides sp. OttesenSCG-928-G07]
MKTFSQIISFLFHPLLMVTYGMILVLHFTYLTLYPDKAKWMIIAGTFISTGIVPGLFILLLIRTGAISGIDIDNRKERAIPYLIIIMSILICAYYLHRVNIPAWLLAILIGACIALLIALFINFFWKISAHTIGIGGLLGGVMGVSRLLLLNPYWAFMLLFVLTGLVAASRIYLQKHTPLQTYAGALLGFMSTFTASIFSYYYLFI